MFTRRGHQKQIKLEQQKQEQQQHTEAYISALGICGIVGYEAEVNHCIGLCKEARTDNHLLLTIASIHTHNYITRRKHRIMYACFMNNGNWFDTLYNHSNHTDIITLRTRANESLYHLVCKLQQLTNFNYEPSLSNERVEEIIDNSLHILNSLATTSLDFNIRTNTNNKIAFDQLMDSMRESKNRRYSIAKHQIIDWWLDHIDRISDEHINPYFHG